MYKIVYHVYEHSLSKAETVLPQKVGKRLNCDSATPWQKIKYTKVTEDLFVKKKMV